MSGLKPFWRYYGGKWRAAPRYPAPACDRIIEPFAGAAGYAMRYPEKHVVLVEAHPIIAELWRYLIGASEADIRALPLVEHVDDLPAGTAAGARALVGFAMNAATVLPCRQLSAGRRKMRGMGRIFEGWSEALRHRVASQVQYIRHWQVVEGDYSSAPDISATWFIDPPYNNRAGSYYPCKVGDYDALGAWCRARQGQVIVCENEGADWLPFQPFATLKAGLNGHGSREVIWYRAAA
jgi:hypothetical protein